MVSERKLLALPRRVAPIQIGVSTRVAQLETIAALASDYRRRATAYLAQQEVRARAGVALEDLVSDSWEDYEQVAEAERRLFAAVDDLERNGG